MHAPVVDSESSHPVADSILCAKCNAPIPIADGDWARCPYCGHNQAIPARKREELHRYRHAVGAMSSRIDHQRAERANLAGWYGPEGKGQSRWKMFRKYAVPILAIQVLFLVLVATHRVDPAQMTRVVGPVALVAFFLAFVVFGNRAGSKREKRDEQPPAQVAQCPHCGGPLPFEIGQTGCSCPHCGEAVVADSEVIDRALEGERGELRSAAMARYRLERTAFSTVYRSTTGHDVPYIVACVFLGITSALALFVTFLFLSDERLRQQTVALPWFLALATACIVLVLRNKRRSRRVRISNLAEVANTLADQVNGTASSHMSNWVDWLNQFWVGPYPIMQLFPSRHFQVAFGTLRDYPVAFDFDPAPLDKNNCLPRVDVFLAAVMPLDAALPAVPPGLRKRALRLQCTLVPNTGGLIARSNQVDTLLAANPANAAQTLHEMALLLVDWGNDAKVLPAQPIP